VKDLSSQPATSFLNTRRLAVGQDSDPDRS
jgi:hypothetical protein